MANGKHVHGECRGREESPIGILIRPMEPYSVCLYFPNLKRPPLSSLIRPQVKLFYLPKPKTEEAKKSTCYRKAQICPFVCFGRSVGKCCVDKLFHMPCNEATNVKQIIPF